MAEKIEKLKSNRKEQRLMGKKKKSLVGYIYKCEFNNVLYWQDEWIMINEDYAPFKSKRVEYQEEKVCGCRGKHPIQKVRITIEELK